jgi:hypothetical protein
MPKRLLTDRTLKSVAPAPAGKRIDLMDTIVPGFGVRIGDKVEGSGEKRKAAQVTFILTARFPGSKNPTRRSLGEYGKLSLEDAREKARDWHALIRKGIDPAEVEERHRQAEQDKRDAKQARDANTFGFVAEEFIKRHVAQQRRAAVSEREIRTELLGQKWDRKSEQWRDKERRWKDRPIESISKLDVVELVDKIVDRGAKRHAHNILGHVRTIFNWAINRGKYGIEQSPCDRLKPKELIGVKAVRQRVLNDAELRSLWLASGTLGYPYGPFVRLLMLTGTRLAESAEAEWQEFNLGQKLWTIPPERFKSDTAHLVPLSSDAVEVLRTLPQFNSGNFVFSATHGRKPVNGFSKAKSALDGLIAANLPGEVDRWTFHDIRRTVRTRLSALRVPEPVAEMVIGHGKKGLARVYDQHQYLDEMREALDAWAAKLREIVTPPPANVVKMPARA